MEMELCRIVFNLGDFQYHVNTARGAGCAPAVRPAPRNARRPIPASLESYHSNTRRQKGADECKGGHIRGTLTESLSWQALLHVLFYSKDPPHD